MSKKFIITEEEKLSILKQYGIISEQSDPPTTTRRTINRDQPMPMISTKSTSDYFGKDNSFEKNYVSQVTTKNDSYQSNPILKQEQEFQELKSKYKNEVPYKEYYTSKNELFKEWVRKRIRNLNPVKYASTFKNESIEFFKNYFDYNSKPEIIKKIVSISSKNGTDVSESFVKKTIDKLINDYLPRVLFVLDFEFNKDDPKAMMYVRPTELDGIVHICAFNKHLIGDYYILSSPEIWKETVLHEIGHLVDGYFNMLGIKFYSSDGGKKGFSKLVQYPHKLSSSNFFDFKFGDLDLEKKYRQRPSEQFTRFKVLFDILSKKGLKINSDLSTFIVSFQKSLNDGTISTKNNCETKIDGGILTFSSTCEDLKDVYTKTDFLEIYVGFYVNSSISWLFENYTNINIVNPNNSIEQIKVEYTINLNDMYQDWKNEYVLNIDKTNVDSKSSPDYPTA